MTYDLRWNLIGDNPNNIPIDGLIEVENYQSLGKQPEEIVMMEKAKEYGATAVFFEAEQNGKPLVAQAFIFVAKIMRRRMHSESYIKNYGVGVEFLLFTENYLGMSSYLDVPMAPILFLKQGKLYAIQ